MEVNMNDCDLEELMIYLENKVRDNRDSNSESKLYEEFMVKGKIHIRFDKVLRRLKRELDCMSN